MTTRSVCLYETAAAAASQVTIYTCPAGSRVIIDRFSVYGVAASTLTVNLVPSGGAAGATNVIEDKTFAAGDEWQFPNVVGQTLNAGDFISILATANPGVNVRVSGRVVT